MPRAINQNYFEKTFASLRGYGLYNTSPDVTHITSAFKASLLNKFFSRHSLGANCEAVKSSGAQDNLRCFLTSEKIASISELGADEQDVVPDIDVDHYRIT